MLQPFNNLQPQDKIDFFLHCQSLLTTYHSDSPFLFTKQNLKERLTYASEIMNKYKGFVYTSPFAAILFNKIKITNPDDPVGAIKEYSFKAAAIDYDTIVIDFATSRNVKDYLGFCTQVYDSHIEWLVWIKAGKPIIHPCLPYASKILNIPIVSK